ncbi:MAG: dephospho-CoA kinase [Armatimonadetes bacterium]|nr:dephospho-CoA kinase [Armatimonadota bacterium]
MAFILGITGGIGTGKSTALGIFAELGAETLSADDIARDVLQKDSPAYKEVVERFGKDVVGLDGQIDRSALARIIFSDDKARQYLDSITHPIIISELKRRIDDFRRLHPSDKAVLAVEIPLLIECGLEDIVDEVLLIAAEQETQKNRLTSRSQISSAEALRRIRSQMSLERKIERSDRVICNDKTIDSLRTDILDVWNEILLL